MNAHTKLLFSYCSCGQWQTNSSISGKKTLITQEFCEGSKLHEMSFGAKKLLVGSKPICLVLKCVFQLYVQLLEGIFRRPTHKHAPKKSLCHTVS